MSDPDPILQWAKHRYSIFLTKDGSTWYYDGPTGAGPRHVRTSSRGPYWRGEVSAQFAGALRRRLAQMRAEASV